MPGDIEARGDTGAQASSGSGVLPSVPASPDRASGVDVSSLASPQFTPTSPELMSELVALITTLKDQTEAYLNNTEKSENLLKLTPKRLSGESN